MKDGPQAPGVTTVQLSTHQGPSSRHLPHIWKGSRHTQHQKARSDVPRCTEVSRTYSEMALGKETLEGVAGFGDG